MSWGTWQFVAREAASSKRKQPRKQPQYDAKAPSVQNPALRVRGPYEYGGSKKRLSLLVHILLDTNEPCDQHTSVLADARHTRAVRVGRKAQAATGRTVLQRSQTRAFGFAFSKVHAVQTQAPLMVGTGARGAGAASAAAA